MFSLRSSVVRSAIRSRSTVVRAPRTGSQLQQWRQAVRGYASKAGETVKENLGSDMPWLIGATVVTVPGTYFILRSGGSSDHGEHGDHGHGKEGHEEHDEEEAAEEEGAEAEGKGEAEGEDAGEERKADTDGDDKEAVADKAEDKSSEEKSDASEAQVEPADDSKSKSTGTKQKSTQSSNEGKNVPEQPSDNTISSKTADGKEGAAFDEEHELESDEKGNKVIHKPDAKGGAKRRVESKNAISLGADANPDAQGTHDKAASSKEPEAGKTSGKQAGLSNTDTKHSTDPVADKKSVKSEGAPDTAKLQGTVDPSRPAK